MPILIPVTHLRTFRWATTFIAIPRCSPRCYRWWRLFPFTCSTLIDFVTFVVDSDLIYSPSAFTDCHRYIPRLICDVSLLLRCVILVPFRLLITVRSRYTHCLLSPTFHTFTHAFTLRISISATFLIRCSPTRYVTTRILFVDVVRISFLGPYGTPTITLRSLLGRFTLCLFYVPFPVAFVATSHLPHCLRVACCRVTFYISTITDDPTPLPDPPFCSILMMCC